MRSNFLPVVECFGADAFELVEILQRTTDEDALQGGEVLRIETECRQINLAPVGE